MLRETDGAMKKALSGLQVRSGGTLVPVPVSVMRPETWLKKRPNPAALNIWRTTIQFDRSRYRPVKTMFFKPGTGQQVAYLKDHKMPFLLYYQIDVLTTLQSQMVEVVEGVLRALKPWGWGTFLTLESGEKLPYRLVDSQDTTDLQDSEVEGYRETFLYEIETWFDHNVLEDIESVKLVEEIKTTLHDLETQEKFD